MFRLINTCALCVLIFANSIVASRILVVVPSPSISHQVVFRPLTQELARRGHDVTIITTDPAFPKGQAPENLTEIDVHDFAYREWRKILKTLHNGEKDVLQKKIEQILTVYLNIFEEQTKVPEVQDIINNKNSTFDLLIVEAMAWFTLGFSHTIKAPVIAMSSFGALFDNYEVIGAPVHPLLYPGPNANRLYNLSLWEKIVRYYGTFSLKHFLAKRETVDNVVIRRIFGEDTPPLSQLKNNVDMLFLNIHPLWEGNRPVPPGVIHIGGLHQKPPKELPQDLKKYLDSSKHGVIYISFGTNVETSVLPTEKIQEIIKAFSHLPYDVLWKWNQDELPGRTENIKISKWFPQSDLPGDPDTEFRTICTRLASLQGYNYVMTKRKIMVIAPVPGGQLRHPKIKLFITQGGLQSTDEAITAGVPLIGVPMLSDQWSNVEKYVHHKIGMHMELASLEADTLKSAIETIIDDNSYRENIVRLRNLMNDQPMSSLERAVWWTEHVLRHGGARHMRAPAANMPIAEYYELELVLILLTITLAAIVLGFVVITKIVKVASRQIRNSIKVKSL